MARISIVVPVFNEAPNLRAFIQRTKAVALGLPEHSFQVIFVDDGSKDGSADLLRDLAAEESMVTALLLSRNFGHQAALTAGLDHADGDAIVMMDGDLQHPPELIPTMIQKWLAGAEVVYTIRRPSRSTNPWREGLGRFFYGLLSTIARVEIHQGAADFRLLNRRAADSLGSMRERQRFLRGMVSWIGFRQEALEFEVADRFAGRSKYSLRRLLRFAADGVMSFSSFPLRLSFYLGLIIAAIDAVLIVNVCVDYYFNNLPPGWATLACLVLFFGGMNLIVLGIMGEYIARIYEQSKERPLYFIRASFGPEAPAEPSDPRSVRDR
jgi:dolichol-phosphate mannosyltransferase